MKARRADTQEFSRPCGSQQFLSGRSPVVITTGTSCIGPSGRREQSSECDLDQNVCLREIGCFNEIAICRSAQMPPDHVHIVVEVHPVVGPRFGEQAILGPVAVRRRQSRAFGRSSYREATLVC